MKTLFASIVLLVLATSGSATETIGRFCFGHSVSGLGPPVCPCGDNGGIDTGCLNSTGIGGSLGTIPLDDYAPTGTLGLAAYNLTPGTVVMFCQGTTAIDAIFGDGRRCIGGSVKRLAVLTVDGTGSAVHNIRDTLGYRMYQAWYRHVPPYCTPATFNMTNALGVAWIP